MIGDIIKVILFFLGLWKEHDIKKSEQKKVIAKEIIDAFSEVDRKKQASRLNAAVGKINRLT